MEQNDQTQQIPEENGNLNPTEKKETARQEESTKETENKDTNKNEALQNTEQNIEPTEPKTTLEKDTSPPADTNETQKSAPEQPREKNDTKAETSDPTAESDEDDETEEKEEDYIKLSREQLVVMLENLVEEANIENIKSRVGMIKVTFQRKSMEEAEDKQEEPEEKTDSTKKAGDELLERFNKAFAVYKEKKVKQKEQLELQKQENFEKKKQVLENLKLLIESEDDLKKNYDAFKQLQVEWKEIGQVPQKENNTLWQNYHFLVEKFLDKVRINKELRDLDLKKNLESKIELCEKVEELLLETSINKSFKKLQEYHQNWKEIGPVPSEKNEEIWERFKNATEKINNRRKEFYDQLYAQQEKNYTAKVALCEKVEAIKVEEINTHQDWSEQTKTILELQKVWRTIGFAPKKVNDEIWNRFRSAINRFFAIKKEFYEKIKEEQTDNYNRKVEICIQAEAVQDNNNWKKTTEELIRLQQAWKKIGPVPRKHSDKIWKRFRAACDHFFEKKSEYFNNIEAIEQENLKKKEDLIEKVKNTEFGEDKKENLAKIKEIQREFTKIGHVPIKEKDKIHETFRNAVDDVLEKLKISAFEKNTLEYKTRIDDIIKNPKSRILLIKEKNQIKNQISKISSDITLWENNMGFLADSKKADVLKNEFQKKINNAKNEVTKLENRVKILEKTLNEKNDLKQKQNKGK